MTDATEHRAAGGGNATPDRVRCDYCGDLDWTVRKYGRVHHKEACPHRTQTYSQTHPSPTRKATRS
jgi:hypothetical protein